MNATEHLEPVSVEDIGVRYDPSGFVAEHIFDPYGLEKRRRRTALEQVRKANLILALIDHRRGY